MTETTTESVAEARYPFGDDTSYMRVCAQRSR
jgi:hypothetical protein